MTKVLISLLLGLSISSCGSDNDSSSSGSGNLGSEAPPVLEFSPKYQYVVLTLDDGVRGEDMQKFLLQLQTASDGLGIRKNPDGSNVRFTYFITTNSTEWSSVELWHALGNEASNHTVTHGVNSETYLTNHTRPQWLQEMTDLEIMMKLYILPEEEIDSDSDWIDTAVTGFRCPFLACNENTFEALAGESPAYFTDKRKAFPSIKAFYDSSIVFTVPNAGFKKYPHPVKLLDCDTIYGSGALAHCASWIQEENLDSETADMMWEIPFPNFFNPDKDTGKGPAWDCVFRAMELPICPPPFPTDQIAATLQKNLEANLQIATTNNKAPFIISLHTSEFFVPEKFEGLLNFINAHSGPNGDVTFVTMQEIAEMYETETEIYGTTPPAPPPSRCDISNAAIPTAIPAWVPDSYMGSASKTLCHYPVAVKSIPEPDPAPDQCANTLNTTCACNYFCADAQGGDWTGGYGDLCALPTVLTSNTCNSVCGGAVSSETFTPGAAAWLGNPGGNSTPGSQCDTFPEGVQLSP